VKLKPHKAVKFFLNYIMDFNNSNSVPF